MLQSLRKSAGSFVIKILFGLLVISFAVWGIGDSFFGSAGGNTVATVGDTEITVRELDNAFRTEMNRLRRFSIDEEQARQLGVLDQVLERLIALQLVDQGAGEMGVVVGREVVQDQIRKQLGQNITSNELQSRLRNAGLTEGQFVSQIRQQIMAAEYQGSLTAGVKAPKVLADRLYLWRGEKRKAKLIMLPVDQSSPVADPTDEQLEAYYKAHPAEYTAPEYRALSYVFLDPKAAAATITVPEEKLREMYDQRKPEFTIPETRTVLQMLVPDRATADKAIDRLRAGEDFATVAKEIADQDDSATQLGTVTKSDLPNAIADAVFGLEKDKVSDPIEGPFGLQVVKVTEIEPGRTQSFDEARDALAKEAAEVQAIDSVLDMTSRLEESIGAGASLPETATELGLELHKLPAVDREGLTPNDNAVEDLPPAPFLQVAFDTEDGGDSLLNETAESSFFLLHVDSVTPPALKPLDTIRDEVVDDWKAEQRWKAAREEARKLVDRLNGGAQIADIAQERDVTVTDTEGFTRSGEGAPPNMPSGLVADLFAAKTVGRAASADGVGGIAIAQLAAIDKAKPEADKEATGQLTQSLDRGMANDITTQLIGALRNRYGVDVNQAAIKANFFSDADGS